MLRRLTLLAAVVALSGAAAAHAGGAPAQEPQRAEPSASAADRFATCMRVARRCGRRVVEGDIPYASFRDRSGGRPVFRVCVRDKDGRYCLPRRRPTRGGGTFYQPVLYKNTGPQLTTWRVKGKIVGRWRWRVVPEPE